MLLGSIVISLLAASSAPTPLYATYADAWHFSPITTTVVFGVYAIAVLVSLLVFGRVSEHLGRRPVLLAALALQITATAILATAQGVDALLLGRVLQGISTGGAVSALGAAMMDIDRHRGAVTNAAAPGIGTGTGALLSGWLVQYAPAPTHLVYLVLIGVFVVQGTAVLRMPETVHRTPGLRAALVPRMAVPTGLWGPVLAAAPILFATWALAGFYGSLGPALARQLSGSHSTVVAALGLFLLTVAGTLSAAILGRTPPHKAVMLGIALLTAATLAALTAIDKESAPGFFGSTIIAGLGFGAGFQGGLRTVVSRAAPRERAGLLSVLYIVSYLGMGLPSVIAGILVVHGGGLMPTAHHYMWSVLALSAIALAGLLLTNRRPRIQRHVTRDRRERPNPQEPRTQDRTHHDTGPTYSKCH
ncbi:MFS transporter [Streptomyces violaceusniger]|uniref:Major facilitator superfamily MFS_1 n=1 Tax=Streptomyces violaceusniger (strain Tu 4113) TaxID=653045 RepID=G2P867_STRV4|nr:MFS transporter [Streptomyces violaceusniger]AEM85868.1 major facilitator superfamily MFS_1 [Streptomyces violaceusniger Tu 4113]